MGYQHGVASGNVRPMSAYLSDLSIKLVILSVIFSAVSMPSCRSRRVLLCP